MSHQIAGIGTGYANAASMGLLDSGVMGTAAQLAVMLLENEQTETQSERETLRAARDAHLEAAAQEVAAMHAAADSVESGALVSAAFTLGGGVCEIGAGAATLDQTEDQGALDDLKAGGTAQQAELDSLRSAVAHDGLAASRMDALGKTLNGLAGPANSLLGEGPAEHDRAEAKRHGTEGEQADWAASDAQSAIDRANRTSDQLLDRLSAMQSEQNAATNALIGRI